MTEWILMKDEKPRDRIFWGFVMGRMEQDGYRDAEIRLFANDYDCETGLGDLRTLDRACRYCVEGYTSILSEWDTVIAWMPIDKMPLPKNYKLEE